MKKLENITTLLKKLSDDSSPITSKKIQQLVKEIYIEKMFHEVSANKIDNIITSNKGLKKQSEESTGFLGAMIAVNMISFSMVAILLSILMQNSKESLTSTISFFYPLIFLVLMCFVSLFHPLKVKIETKKKIKNRLIQLNQDIKPDSYKEIIKKTSSSILNDLEEVDGFIDEKNFMKNFIIAKDGVFDNEGIKDIEKILKKEFYEKLILVEKDISNKIIVQIDTPNDLLKVNL